VARCEAEQSAPDETLPVERPLLVVLQPAEARAVPGSGPRNVPWPGPRTLAPRARLALGQPAAALDEVDGGELAADAAGGLLAGSADVLQAVVHRRAAQAPRRVDGAQVAACDAGEDRASCREVACGSLVEPRALGEAHRGVADVGRRVAADRRSVAEASGSPTVEACGTQDAAHCAAGHPVAVGSHGLVDRAAGRPEEHPVLAARVEKLCRAQSYGCL